MCSVLFPENQLRSIEALFTVMCHPCMDARLVVLFE
jgi:hypothetical protein